MSNAIPDQAGWLFDEYDGPRFWSHVNFHGGTAHEADPLATASGECWVWTGWERNHYGHFIAWGKRLAAHRLAYRDAGRKIPDGYDVDHLCRNTMCVNPDHLEAVSERVNVQRGLVPLVNREKCNNGHDLTPDNIIITKRKEGQFRRCRICRSESSRNQRLRALGA